MRWRRIVGSVATGLATVTACALADATAARDDARPTNSGLPRSGRRFWQRLWDPSGERAAQIRVLVERLMMKAERARREPDVARRLYASVAAVVELSRVGPRGAGELGFLVGHALVECDHHNDRIARAWLSSAIEECPHSALVFAAWLDLARLCARRNDTVGGLGAITRASGLAITPSDFMRLHLARGMAYEHAGELELARREYVAWTRLDVDESSVAQAGWHLAVVLDLEGEHLAAQRIIDEAEARAYDRAPNELVAIDSPDTRWSANSLASYAEGVKYRWIAERRLSPPPFESQRRALTAFRAVARSTDAGPIGMARWHIGELERAILKR